MVSGNRSVIPMDDFLDVQLRTLRDAVEQHNDGSLVVLPDGSLGLVQRRFGQYVTNTLSIEALTATLMRWVAPIKRTYDRNGVQRDTSVPVLGKTLVAAYRDGGDWPGVPRVKRLMPAPVFRPDWTVVYDEGYDEASETYVTEGMTALSGTVTEAEALAARDGLWRLFDPFALEGGDGGRADCLALALTPYLASALPSALLPAAVAQADKEGSGKTNGLQMIGVIGTGSVPQARALPVPSKLITDITTVLNDGNKRASLYDNVKVDLSDPALEALITGRAWSERAFHTQRSLDLPNDTLWMFSMNNPVLSPDMRRRAVVVSFSPERVPTTWNPRAVADAVEQVATIRTWVVTLIRWWVQQGCTRGPVTMSGFEDWSETVTGILGAVGITGVLEASMAARDAIYTEDEDIAAIINRIAHVMGHKVDGWTASDLQDEITDFKAVSDVLDANRRALRAWFNVSEGGSGSSVGIGRKLAKIAGKRLDKSGADFAIVRTNSSTTQGARYVVEPLRAGVPAIRF